MLVIDTRLPNEADTCGECVDEWEFDNEIFEAALTFAKFEGVQRLREFGPNRWSGRLEQQHLFRART